MQNLLKIYKKNNKMISLFLLAFAFYFFIGLIVSYYLNTAVKWSVFYSLDTPRVLEDLTVRSWDHYRLKVHPLFSICLWPFVYILKHIFGNHIVGSLCLEAIVSSLSLIIMTKLLLKIITNKNVAKLLIILFGLSFSQIIYSVSIETYIFAQFFLILMWNFVYFKIDTKLTYWDYIILVLLGLGCIAITVTNFIQFIIAIFVLVFCNKKEDKKFLNSILIISVSIAFAALFASIQSGLFGSSPNFITKNLIDLLNHNSGELDYISLNINLKSFLNVINSCFGYSYNLFNFYVNNGEILFENNVITSVISILLFINFIFINGLFIIKEKFSFTKYKFYYALLISWLFNFILHLFYGNDSSFIYVCHYNFLTILILAHLIEYFKLLKSDLFTNILIILTIILSLRVIICYLKLLFSLYIPLNQFLLAPFFIIIIIVIYVLFNIIKTN